MKVIVFHASKFGNGARVSEEIKKIMEAHGHEVVVHHVHDMRPKDVPPADLYVFGSPTHFSKAPGNIMGFIRKIQLPVGTRYAVFATCSAARPNKKTGAVPSEEEMAKERRAIPMMDERLRQMGLKKVAEMTFFVSPEQMKGTLEDGWLDRVAAFAAQVEASER